eukprot:1425587-Amphidinium_carterae.1
MLPTFVNCSSLPKTVRTARQNNLAESVIASEASAECEAWMGPNVKHTNLAKICYKSTSRCKSKWHGNCMNPPSDSEN